MITLLYKAAKLAIQIKAAKEAADHIADVIPDSAKKIITGKAGDMTDKGTEVAVDLLAKHAPKLSKKLAERFAPPASKQQKQLDDMATQMKKMSEMLQQQNKTPKTAAAKKPARKTAAKKTAG